MKKVTSPVLPLVWGAICLLVLVVTLFLSHRPPVIHSISPPIAGPGEILVIRGENFGDSKNRSLLSIAGYTPTRTVIELWSDQEIRVELPAGLGSGLVVVKTDQGVSEGVLFSNREDLPIIAGQSGSQGQPVVDEILPRKGKIGELLYIRGENFGESREGGSVSFTWGPIRFTSPSGTQDISDSIEAPLENFEFWSSREIQVRIPTGAASGNIVVNTPRGDSNPVFFELGDLGNRVISNPRTYTVSLRSEVNIEEASGENRLYLWFPRPFEDSLLRDFEIINQTQVPIMDNYSGLDLFLFENLRSGESRRITRDLLFRVYDYEVDLLPGEVTPFDETDSIFYRIYTVGDYLVPVDHPQIAVLLQQIVGRETNPYDQVAQIWDFLLSSIRTNHGGTSDPLEAYESRSANAKGISLLLTTLARKAGIPARPVSGFLVDSTLEYHPHFWVEVFFMGVGWFPLDPALADGLLYNGFPQITGRREYFFGNIDHFHIAVSKGVAQARQMELEGLTRYENHPISYQTINDEAVGNLEKYSVIWHDMANTGN